MKRILLCFMILITVATWVLYKFTSEFIAGLFFGFVSNIIVGLYFSWDQFQSSTSGYRLKKVVEATRKIFDPEANISRERDRYRYSLGVIIDELKQTFGREGDFEDKEWPCLVDYNSEKYELSKDENGNDIDRWKHFERYVRPVVDDINNSSFIGNYRLIRSFSKDVRQLYALTKLCNHLENVVSELDAAFQAEKLVKLNDKNHVVPQENQSKSDGFKRLEKEYHDLFNAWREWLRAAK